MISPSTEGLCWLWPASCTNTITPLSLTRQDTSFLWKVILGKALTQEEDKQWVGPRLDKMMVKPA